MDILEQKYFFDKASYSMEQKNLFCVLTSNVYYKWIRTGVTGKDILMKLDGTRTLGQVIAEISAEYKIPEEIVRADAIEFCQQARNNDLLFASPGEAVRPEADQKIRQLSIDVTNYCNRRCAYCSVNTCGRTSDAAFVPVATVQGYLATLFPEGKCPNTSIYVTGGEPLYHGQIMDILDAVASYEGQTILWTNGTLLDDSIAEQLSKRKVVVFLSLDSAQAGVNDAARGAGSWLEATRASQACRQCGVEYLYCVTIGRHNLRHLEDLIGLAQEAGARGILLNQQIVCTQEGASLQEHFDYSFDDFYDRLISFSKKVNIINSWRNKNTSYKTALRIIREDSFCLNSLKYLQPKVNCGAGINRLAIDVRGRVYPCRTLQTRQWEMGGMADYMRQREHLEALPEHLRKFPACRNCEAEIFCLGSCKGEIMSFAGRLDAPYEPYCRQKKDTMFRGLWAPLLMTKLERTEVDER